MKYYVFKGNQYSRLSEIRALMANVSFPAKPTDEQLSELGITVISVELPAPPAPPELTLEEAKEIEKGKIATLRYRDETAGISVGDWQIATDRETQSKIMAAVLISMTNPDYVIPNWKMRDGIFVELDANQIMNIALVISEHVQACFDKEARLRAAIDAATTIEEVKINGRWDPWTDAE